MEDKLIEWRRMVEDQDRHDYGIGDYWNALDDACDLIEQLKDRMGEYRAFAQYLIEERGQLLEELRVAEKALEQVGP